MCCLTYRRKKDKQIISNLSSLWLLKDWGQSKAGGEWQTSVDCLNNQFSTLAWPKKENIQRKKTYKFLSQNQMINKQVYKEILWCMIRSILRRDKRKISWLLHCVNLIAHTTLSIRQFRLQYPRTGTMDLFTLPCFVGFFSFPWAEGDYHENWF